MWPRRRIHLPCSLQVCYGSEYLGPSAGSCAETAESRRRFFMIYVVDFSELFKEGSGRVGDNILGNLVSSELLHLWSSPKRPSSNQDGSSSPPSRVPPRKYSQQPFLNLCFLCSDLGVFLFLICVILLYTCYVFSSHSFPSVNTGLIRACLEVSFPTYVWMSSVLLVLSHSHWIKFLPFNKKKSVWIRRSAFIKL